jgi:hypothetical protein
MNMLKKFVSGLGQQTAPFGFAPEDPNASYKAGLSYIGDIGANLMANNRGGVDPFANLGTSIQQAKQSGTQRNKEAYTAQRLMEEAALKRQEREKAAASEAQREEFLKSLPPDVQMKARSVPGFLEAYVEATDPNLQKPEQPKLYTVDGALVDANGNVVYQGEGGSGRNGILNQIQERQMGAEAMGLNPDDPAYQSYILTGKMPREDQAPLTATDKKAILDADDAVLANTAVIDQLNSVITPDASGKSLNDRAGEGAFAGLQSFAARNDPVDWISGGNVKMFDDTTGQATTELQNIVLGQALSSLKSIFGAAPTEGERKILIDLQASIDKTPAERKPIIERAIRMAKARLKFNEERAASLRGGFYYKSGGGPATSSDGITIELVEE